MPARQLTMRPLFASLSVQITTSPSPHPVSSALVATQFVVYAGLLPSRRRRHDDLGRVTRLDDERLVRHGSDILLGVHQHCSQRFSTSDADAKVDAHCTIATVGTCRFHTSMERYPELVTEAECELGERTDFAKTSENLDDLSGRNQFGIQAQQPVIIN